MVDRGGNHISGVPMPPPCPPSSPAPASTEQGLSVWPVWRGTTPCNWIPAMVAGEKAEGLWNHGESVCVTCLLFLLMGTSVQVLGNWSRTPLSIVLKGFWVVKQAVAHTMTRFTETEALTWKGRVLRYLLWLQHQIKHQLLLKISF